MKILDGPVALLNCCRCHCYCLLFHHLHHLHHLPSNPQVLELLPGILGHQSGSFQQRNSGQQVVATVNGLLLVNMLPTGKIVELDSAISNM